MKYIHRTTSLLLVTPLLVVAHACNQNHSADQPGDNAVYEAQIPLIYHMSFMNLYTAKLYFSGVEENWELADIYAHEIEEISEMIIEDNYMKHGVDIGALFESMLLPGIEQVEEAIEDQNKDLFLERFQILIQSCDRCHAATDYSEVQILVPDMNPFNQDFSLPGPE